ncbi:MAG: alpha-ketoacid dehydrogenase subunit beta [Candidatus Mariimomonas ferrooxydans]
MRQLTYADAISEAQAVELERDPDVFIAGEDIGLAPFGATSGLLEKFGKDRVKDTPISETAIVGLGVGAAAAGLRPVVEIMYVDFFGVCLDEIANQAAKMRYMFGGKAKIPLVIRTTCGAGVRGAAHHSQSLEAWVTHVPGLKIVMPSNSYDAKGLLISSIRDDNPVIFLEHKALYSAKSDCPEDEYTVPLGEAKILKEGSDITVIAWSLMAVKALNAANELKKDGIDAEVIDIRTLVPLDKKTILDSVKKTGKVVIVQEAVKTSGFAGEISAIITEEAFSSLKGPIMRVTAPDTCIPFSPILEDSFIPDEGKIINAVKGLVS